MTKLVSYACTSHEVKKDVEWRRKFICGFDKEYSIISKTNGAQGHFAKLKIRVSDDTAIIFKMRYPHCKITSL